MTPIRKPDYQIGPVESPEPGRFRSLDIGQVPTVTIEVRPEHRIFVHTDPRGPGADRLRFLGIRLNQVWDPEKLKKLLITSPLPHEGKSTVSLNLAVTLAEGGRRPVLMIDGDLQRPATSRELGMDNLPGVAECLESGADACSSIRLIEPIGCYFLPAGRARGNPSELLQRETLPKLMESVSRHFDWVLVDSPPVVPLTDTLSWKERTDATILLAKAGSTPVHAVDGALNLLGRKHVLAILLNRVEGIDRLYKKYYKAYDIPR